MKSQVGTLHWTTLALITCLALPGCRSAPSPLARWWPGFQRGVDSTKIAGAERGDSSGATDELAESNLADSDIVDSYDESESLDSPFPERDEAIMPVAYDVGSVAPHGVASLPPMASDSPLPLSCGCASCAAGACEPNDCANRPRNPNEYLCDGDDVRPNVRLTADGRVQGLDSEDTVAIYDTDLGDTEVTASNRVCVYAPRFAAVRKVLMAHEGAGVDGSRRVVQPVGPAKLDALAEARSRGTKTELLAGRLARKVGGLQAAAQDGVVSTQLGPGAFQDRFMPFENLRSLRTGRMQAGEEALLEQRLAAARVWTDEQAVQVVLDGVSAGAATATQRTATVFKADPLGKAKLRLWKVASTDSALPGDEIDFTIRFDNIGTRAIERVTLMDRLTMRLEYVEGSAQASRAATFSTEPADGVSLVLHWDFEESLPAGDGGLVRFRCRVR